MARKLLIRAYVCFGTVCFYYLVTMFSGRSLSDLTSVATRPAVAITLVQSPAVETEKLKQAPDRLESAPAPAIGDGGLGTVPEPRKYTWTELEDEFARLRSERKTRPEALHELSAWYERAADPKFTASKDFLDHFEKLKLWHDEKPDSSTRLVVLAKSYIGFAWQARGSGFAATVTEEGWALFHGRMSEARRLLDQAIEKGVKDGEAYALMIEIAKVEGDSEEEALEWLKAGQKVDPSYAWMYAKMAEFLLPRWHGEPGDIERFAVEMTRQVPGDDGLDAFAHIVWQVHRYDRRTLWWGEYDRALLGKAAKVLATRYSQETHLVSFAGLCAYAAQDHASAVEINKLVGKYDEREGIWPSVLTHAAFVQWASGPAPILGQGRWYWASPSGISVFGFDSDAGALWFPQEYGGEILSVDEASGQVRQQLPGPGGLLSQFEFDNSRNWIVAAYWRGSFKGWTLWDLKEQESHPHPTQGIVSALAIHPTEKQIAWAESMTVRIFDLSTGKEVSKFSLPDPVQQLEISPKGDQLYVKSLKNKKYVFDPKSGEIVYELPRGGKDSPLKLSSGEFAAFDEQNRIYMTAFDLSSTPIKRCFARGTPDGKSWDILIPEITWGNASLSRDRTQLAVAIPDMRNQGQGIEVWNVPKALVVARLDGHWNHINSMHFSHDGNKLACCAGNIVKIWKIPPAEDE